ncbi:septal ring lytic transglycosylase RlpA family protein [Roseibacillus ishigakijimensis]|uniref:Probable endolytic peptidoglycan transglycosylase RlpA n=1 Tax=Roseibacillus ishigakijimensis TaxID=454146 RepID=A0A934RPA4_9BACT|nr:septal ring lytic transglycosylase RlpA family protein [Roseibacillus ishigakijimensis]MBK1834473.1 septal ring lytic transglycosylase RlpA family protein [Roseibacillus ishigakijimensis]
MLRLVASLSLLTALVSCADHPPVVESAKASSPPPAEKKVVKPKLIAGKYIVASTQRGKMSWYSVKTNGGTKTASGKRFTNAGATAAHRTLAFGSKVRVTNLRNNRSQIVTITDRGPFIKGRIIDVSIGTARKLGFVNAGVVSCKVEVLKTP